MESKLNKIIHETEDEFAKATSVASKLNILYNLITLKNNANRQNEIYGHIKELINLYIKLINEEKYGYDSFNYDKINNVLNFISIPEQIQIIKFCISSISRELPEFDKSWFVNRKNNLEIKKIYSSKNYCKYPYAILLTSSLNIKNLLISFIIYFVVVFLILLPSTGAFCLFSIEYSNYSDSFIINHLLNVVSVFADFDNGMVVKPVNEFGFIIMLLAKTAFVLLIVNFVYRKVIEIFTI